MILGGLRFAINKAERVKLFLVLLRLVTLALLVMAAMGPGRSTEPPRKPVQLKILVDHSASIQPGYLQESFFQLMDRLQPLVEKTGVVPEVHLLDGRKLTQIQPDVLMSRVIREPAMKSPIFESIQFALESRNIDRSTRLIVLTDGNDTQAGTEELAALSSHPVWWIPQKSQNRDVLKIRAMQAPTHMLMGQESMMEMLIDSNQSGRVRLLISQENQNLVDEVVDLPAGLTLLQRPYTATSPGLFLVTASVTPEEPDPIPGNNQATAQIRVIRENTVLSLSRPGEDSNLRTILEAMGFKVISHTPEEARGISLQGYSAVMIQDLSKSEVGEELELEIESYVSKGGGLAVFGGPSSYGLGGWFMSRLQDVLPVFCPPRTHRKSLAIALIIDSSGSMLAEDPAVWSDPIRLSRYLATADSANLPINAAKRAAFQVVRDLIGVDVTVLNFNDFAGVAMPITKVDPRLLPAIERDISTIRAGGGTKYQPALRRAMRETKGRGYQEAHFILLSDGVPTDQSGLNEVLADIKNAGVTVSTIAFGKMASRTLLSSMADTTGGKFFNSDSVNTIAESFREAVENVFGPPVKLGTMGVARNHESRMMKDVVFPYTTISGLVFTQEKQGAEVLLRANGPDPLAAVMQYGLGQSFALMTDVRGQWSKELMQSDVVPTLLSMVMPRIMRQEYEPLTLKTMVDGNRLRVSLTAVDEHGDPLAGLQARLTVRPEFKTEDAVERSVDMAALGEGLYLVETVLRQSGVYLAEVEVKNEDIKVKQSARIEIAADAEIAFQGPNQELFDTLQKDRKGSVLSENTSWLHCLKKRNQPHLLPLIDLDIFLLPLLCLFSAWRLFCVDPGCLSSWGMKNWRVWRGISVCVALIWNRHGRQFPRGK